MPTLLIVGGHGEPCVEVQRFVVAVIPGRFGPPHTMLDAPRAFNRAVKAFLGRQRAARLTRGSGAFVAALLRPDADGETG